MLPDSISSASFYFDSLGAIIKKIIMVVMNIDVSMGENQFASYTYSAESTLEVEPGKDHLFDYVLYQNYPNPFNPNTVISYQLPINGKVTLKVYDVLGNEIAVLVDEYKPAGNYEVEFNTSSHSGLSGIRELPSGIYFYKLQAGSFVESKKMVLLK
ncbi:MAG: T9SS type A sorting domain-containing protein [bacterium]|nr:T9SS type A sorting domain-containing protein [bacterium]